MLSPISRNTLEADKAAFTALTRHLNQIDGEQHTILLIQVENESGNVGSVRDYSAQANKEFEGDVPADLLAATGKQRGTWSRVFGGDADEIFQAYHQAKFINEIVAAGKHEFNIPYYINVWIDYPAAQLPQRQIASARYRLSQWRSSAEACGSLAKLAPAIDMIGPDIYADDSQFYRETMAAYQRPDNPLWIPETGRSDSFAKFFFYALGDGAIGFSPFGVDESGWNILGDEKWTCPCPQLRTHRPDGSRDRSAGIGGQTKDGGRRAGTGDAGD